MQMKIYWWGNVLKFYSLYVYSRLQTPLLTLWLPTQKLQATKSNALLPFLMKFLWVWSLLETFGMRVGMSQLNTIYNKSLEIFRHFNVEFYIIISLVLIVKLLKKLNPILDIFHSNHIPLCARSQEDPFLCRNNDLWTC